MNNLSELMLRVRDRAEQGTGVLAPCVSEQDIADAEQVLGFSLPPRLRLLVFTSAVDDLEKLVPDAIVVKPV